MDLFALNGPTFANKFSDEKFVLAVPTLPVGDKRAEFLSFCTMAYEIVYYFPAILVYNTITTVEHLNVEDSRNARNILY